MNLKRRLLHLVYVVLLVGMCYSGLQLFGEKKVQATSGTCCSTSTDCPGTSVCAKADALGYANCCNPPNCKGPDYCIDPM